MSFRQFMESNEGRGRIGTPILISRGFIYLHVDMHLRSHTLIMKNFKHTDKYSESNRKTHPPITEVEQMLTFLPYLFHSGLLVFKETNYYRYI